MQKLADLISYRICAASLKFNVHATFRHGDTIACPYLFNNKALIVMNLVQTAPSCKDMVAVVYVMRFSISILACKLKYNDHRFLSFSFIMTPFTAFDVCFINILSCLYILNIVN